MHFTKTINKFFSFVIIVLVIGSCTQKKEVPQKKEKTDSLVVKIDTTIEGTPGKPGSSIVIRHKADSLLLEYHDKSWDSKDLYMERHQYWDHKAMRFVHALSKDHKATTIANSWSDKWDQSIFSIDSIFTNNQLTGIEISFGKDNSNSYYEYAFSVKKKFKMGKIVRQEIWDNEIKEAYLEEGDKYYDMNTDVAVKYAEWESSFRSIFGEAYTKAYRYMKLALAKIEPKYIDIAKGYGFDKDTFISTYQK